jgi:hypothetical protein
VAGLISEQLVQALHRADAGLFPTIIKRSLPLPW